jgi:multiple sugar transport system substrate-binding protein
MSRAKSKGERVSTTKTASRRRFLRSAGAGAGAALLSTSPAGYIFVREAVAADKELKIILWSHFIPPYDKWYDQFAKDWGVANKVDVKVDHIPHLELAARLAAEISAKAGHDLAGLNGFGPHIYRQSVVDMTSLVNETEKKYGKVGGIGRSIAYDTETHKWPAFPDF